MLDVVTPVAGTATRRRRRARPRAGAAIATGTPPRATRAIDGRGAADGRADGEQPQLVHAGQRAGARAKRGDPRRRRASASRAQAAPAPSARRRARPDRCRRGDRGPVASAAPPHVERRQNRRDQRRGNDEREPGDDEAGETGPLIADVQRHLGGVRPRQQVGGAEQIEERRRGSASRAAARSRPP